MNRVMCCQPPNLLPRSLKRTCQMGGNQFPPCRTGTYINLTVPDPGRELIPGQRTCWFCLGGRASGRLFPSSQPHPTLSPPPPKFQLIHQPGWGAKKVLRCPVGLHCCTSTPPRNSRNTGSQVACAWVQFTAGGWMLGAHRMPVSSPHLHLCQFSVCSLLRDNLPRRNDQDLCS